MLDPTNSRYRYLEFKGVGSYRRFVNEDKNLQPVGLNFQDNTTPAHGTYGALLFRPEWRDKRQLIMQRDLNCCIICKGDTGLQVHHRQYHFNVRQNQFKLPWDYPDQILITLCESCHKRGHSKYRVPTINL